MGAVSAGVIICCIATGILKLRWSWPELAGHEMCQGQCWRLYDTFTFYFVNSSAIYDFLALTYPIIVHIGKIM